MKVHTPTPTATTLSLHNEELVHAILSKPSRSKLILPAKTSIADKTQQTPVRSNTADEKMGDNPFVLLSNEKYLDIIGSSIEEMPKSCSIVHASQYLNITDKEESHNLN